jgi:hypothetical protein
MLWDVVTDDTVPEAHQRQRLWHPDAPGQVREEDGPDNQAGSRFETRVAGRERELGQPASRRGQPRLTVLQRTG